MISLSAAGQAGPGADMRAYAPVMSSFTGLEGLIGYPGETPLGAMNIGFPDPNAAAHALVAILAALHSRERTGLGCCIDLSQIVSRIEETHGTGALAAPAPRRRGVAASLREVLGRPEPENRHIRFTQGAKKALEQSLRVALGRKDRRIGTLHLLLALISRPGPVSEVLADHGVTYAAVETGLAA